MTKANSDGCHQLGSSMGPPETSFPVSGSFFLSSHKSQKPNYKSLFSCFFTSYRHSALRRCHVAEAIKEDVDFLLKGVGDQAVAKEVKHILEMARPAASRREVLHTYFLTPPIVKESVSVLEKLADIKMVAQGGYPEYHREFWIPTLFSW